MKCTKILNTFSKDKEETHFKLECSGQRVSEKTNPTFTRQDIYSVV